MCNSLSWTDIDQFDSNLAYASSPVIRSCNNNFGRALSNLCPPSDLGIWTTALKNEGPWSTVTAGPNHSLQKFPHGVYTKYGTQRPSHPTSNTFQKPYNAPVYHSSCAGVRPIGFDCPYPGCTYIADNGFEKLSELDAHIRFEHSWDKNSQPSAYSQPQAPKHEYVEVKIEGVTQLYEAPLIIDLRPEIDSGLSDSHDAIPGGVPIDELSMGVDSEEVDIHSQQERTCCSLPSTEPFGPEYSTDTCSDDEEDQDTICPIFQIILDQMLSGGLIDPNLPASRFMRTYTGNQRDSKVAQKYILSGPSTPSSSSSNIRKRVREGGGGNEEPGDGGDGGEEPNRQKKPRYIQERMLQPCPFYLKNKDDPMYAQTGTHYRCTLGFAKIVQHITRNHLQPVQCLSCGYRGDKGQLKEHGECSRPWGKFQKVLPREIEMDKQIRARNITWKDLFRIIFPGSSIPVEAEMYISHEQYRPDLLSAFTSFMEPEIKSLIERFRASTQFKDFARQHPIHSPAMMEDIVNTTLLGMMVSSPPVTKPPATPNPGGDLIPPFSNENTLDSSIDSSQSQAPLELISWPDAGTRVASSAISSGSVASPALVLTPSGSLDLSSEIPGVTYPSQDWRLADQGFFNNPRVVPGPIVGPERSVQSTADPPQQTQPVINNNQPPTHRPFLGGPDPNFVSGGTPEDLVTDVLGIAATRNTLEYPSPQLVNQLQDGVFDKNSYILENMGYSQDDTDWSSWLSLDQMGELTRLAELTD